MASIRERHRKDGTPYWSVLYRLDGQQTSTSLPTQAQAEQFCATVDAVGPAKALKIYGIEKVGPIRQTEQLTVAAWLQHYIKHLTGVQRDTIERYRSYARLDINPTLGPRLLADLSRDDITAWINDLVESETSAKTIKNKHGFFSAAMKAAVTADKIGANPCERIRLPRWDRKEMVFLTREQFQTLSAAVTDHWRPMVTFLAASGCRFGEASALRPADVDRVNHTVRIWRAWKYHSGGYELGTPKTKRSVRTIDVPATVLDQLDYTGEYLFLNRDGGPVRIHGFHRRVWKPAIVKAKLDPPPRVHDLRHTCASWMIAAGVPLPVIQRHLGHESITTTVDLYGHMDRSSGQAAAAAIAAALI